MCRVESNGVVSISLCSLTPCMNKIYNSSSLQRQEHLQMGQKCQDSCCNCVIKTLPHFCMHCTWNQSHGHGSILILELLPPPDIFMTAENSTCTNMSLWGYFLNTSCKVFRLPYRNAFIKSSWVSLDSENVHTLSFRLIPWKWEILYV